MPFKVSDLIFFTGEEYCFIRAPEDIEDELTALRIKNMYFTDTASNCSEESQKVCFSSSSGCDIAVYSTGVDSGYVSKEGRNLYYENGLIYGAIFSSPIVYECNVKRLMLRLVNLCLVYKDEIKILERRDCSSVLDSHLSEMINLANNLESSQTLSLIQDKSDVIDNINNAASCKIYET